MAVSREKILKMIGFPLLVIALFLVAYFMWEIFDLPRDEELVSLLSDWFDRYGYPILFISAIVEALLIVGLYYPGSMVIFLGVILSETPLEAVGAVAVVSVAFIIAAPMNYALGKYGWYRLLVAFGFKESLEKAKTRLLSKGKKALIVGYGVPNFAAFTATAAGILGFSFPSFFFYSCAGIVLWNALYGILVYILGASAFVLFGFKAVLFYVLVLVAWGVFDGVRKKESTSETPPGA